MDEKFDDRPLDVIARDMLDWCLSWGCEKLGETDKEYRVQCPNMNCPSRGKSESHKAFDINRDTAQYHCWHCGLSGQGLNGPRGLITQLESGDFFPSANIGRIPNEPSNFFKPEIKLKEKAEPVMSREEVGRARAKGICDDSAAYLKEKRGIPETVYRDFDYLIFSYPKGKQLSFMKQPLNDTAIFFPVFNDEKEVIHVSYKLLHGGYYNSPGPKPIYLTKGTPSSIIVVVEGIFDALSVYTVGYRSAALLGHEITANHDLSVFQDKSIVLMLDNDVEKSKIYAIAKTLVGIAKDVKIATIPMEIDGHQVKDPNDVLVKVGSEKLSGLIREVTVCDIEALSREIAESVDMNATIEVKPSMVSVVEEKPKKESASDFVFPQEAWRGIFETYRQAQEGTTEAPEQYHFAVFKTIAGTIIGRSCYVWNGRNLYPNFYTVLIGPTRRSRKTTAMDRGEKLLQDTDPLVIILRGLATPEGLISRLQIPEAEGLDGLPEIEQQRVASVSEHEGYRMLVCCNEFASLLRKAKKESSSGLIQTLTDAYDCKDTLDNPTRISPLSAKNPFVSMIALSTREWLEKSLDVDDIYGGFVNRNMFYLWTETQPLHNPDEVNEMLMNEIKMKLHGVRDEKKGGHVKYTFSGETDKLLKEWYDKDYYAKYENEIIDAAIQRIDENVRKLALLYAILENDTDDLNIHTDQLRAAITVGEYWKASATRLFGLFGFSQAARSEMKIIELLEQRNHTKREIQQKIGGNMSASEFNQTIEALVKAERIEWIKEKGNKTKQLTLL
jgi:DNA primase